MSAAPREAPRRLEDFLHVAQVGHERQEVALDARAAEARQGEEVVVAGARHGLPELAPRLGARAYGEAPRAARRASARHRGDAAVLDRDQEGLAAYLDKEVRREEPTASHQRRVGVHQLQNTLD